MKKFTLSSLTVVFLILNSCNFSDDIKELGGGYFYRGEGGSSNDILNHSGKKKDIPANVLDYSYNNDFILASQQPNKFDDGLYEKYGYKYGREQIYYWIIIIKKSVVLGPLSKTEFDEARKEYEVSKNLNLK